MTKPLSTGRVENSSGGVPVKNERVSAVADATKERMPAPKPPSPLETAAFERPAPPAVRVRFLLLEPDAQHVSLSGEFNSWSPDSTPMKLHARGHWETTITLAPGRYQYKFIVDGQWIPDPLARENVFNAHGTLNSVVEVPA